MHVSQLSCIITQAPLYICLKTEWRADEARVVTDSEPVYPSVWNRFLRLTYCQDLTVTFIASYILPAPAQLKGKSPLNLICSVWTKHSSLDDWLRGKWMKIRSLSYVTTTLLGWLFPCDWIVLSFFLLRARSWSSVRVGKRVKCQNEL